MNNRPIRIGPFNMVDSPTDLVNPAGPGSGVGYTPTADYLLLQHIRIVNRTNAPVTCSLWIGATGGSAAGSEFWLSTTPIPANDGLDYYGGLRLDAADFLTGQAGGADTLTFEAEGEIGKA